MLTALVGTAYRRRRRVGQVDILQVTLVHQNRISGYRVGNAHNYGNGYTLMTLLVKGSGRGQLVDVPNQCSGIASGGRRISTIKVAIDIITGNGIGIEG